MWPAIDLSLLRAVDFPGVRFRMLDVTMWEAKNPREKTKAVFEPDKWKPAKSSMVDVPVSGLAALLFAHYWIGLHEVLQEPDPDRELLAKCPGKHATGQSDTFRVSPRSKERLCPACSRVHRQGSRRRG
ncbi:MAG: hypothetical protein HY292_18875 [Planctomycetes bacterium]|nr:hypothetical protein [Planctomycetota bacterium]